MDKTSKEVAEWMVHEIRFKGILKQEDAIAYIKSHFGEQFVYVNANGHSSISKEVIKLFRKMHAGTIAWEREGFFWASV
ncbi:hypothetical protein SAMN04488542_1451 [Fontibacillus panacisegetis]|uniref:Integron gene cassette protein n=1 Tax=Fontibacillus panacisegetis TaxID=670482 RepID=A0A1G7UF56_9BACL|nr:hypothetical protein [Fontibacillus panacisegetis]SDG46202.1 hypothetical protein SAMN04488542_1451 [Fontibacillus panacisegetis]